MKLIIMLITSLTLLASASFATDSLLKNYGKDYSEKNSEDYEKVENDISKIKQNLAGDLSKRMSVGNLLAVFIFSSVGFVAFMAGKKRKLLKPMLYGLGLMAYPYFITNLIFVYLIGIGFSLALYFDRE